MTLQYGACFIQQAVTVGEAQLVLDKVYVAQEHAAAAHAIDAEFPEELWLRRLRAPRVLGVYVRDESVARVAPYGEHAHGSEVARVVISTCANTDGVPSTVSCAL